MAFDLQRFVRAQDPVYRQVLTELRAGQKRTHWMWFIFPQLAGLGHSPIAQLYAISSLNEARAYLAHPVLGARLRECAALVNAIASSETRGDRDVHQIFGSPDDLKFHSSVTLFARASDGEQVFADAIVKYFGGEEDSATVELLKLRG
jgi:uncharacterized protein (DUF1810 family)